MTGLLRAELRKIGCRRLFWGLLAGGVAFMGFGILVLPLLARVATDAGADTAALDELLRSIRAPAGYVYAAQSAVVQTVLVWTILAAVAIGNEYSWGTLTSTLVFEPRRLRVLTAKLVAVTTAAAAGTLAMGIVGIGLTAAAQPLLPANVDSVWEGAWPAASAAVVLKGLLPVAVWCAIATSIGVVTRSAAAGAGLGVGMVFADQILGLVPFLRPALITTNTTALLAVGDIGTGGGFGPPGVDISAGQAALVLAAWLGAAFAAAAPVFARRDV
jgi:ABC-2 type transport system permease protein